MQLITERLKLDSIAISERLRNGVSDEAVTSMMNSIQSFGLMTPISVRQSFPQFGMDGSGNEPSFVLVAGRHRLEACKRLNWDAVDCFVLEGSDLECRLWEIAENLHRSELSAQERSDHIAEWLRLTEEKLADAAQFAPHRKAGQQPGGINAVVRELGIERTEAQRAVKIAGIHADARQAADAAGLISQTDRLEIARAPHDEQIDAVRRIAERKAERATRKLHVTGQNDDAAIFLVNALPQSQIDELIGHLKAGGYPKLAKAICAVRAQPAEVYCAAA